MENIWTVQWINDDTMDDVVIYEGTLEQCKQYIAEDGGDDLFIVEPDGFTVYEEAEAEE